MIYYINLRRDFRSLIISDREVFMKAWKGKAVVVARDAKHRLDNPYTEADKAKKSADEAKR